MTFVSEFSIMYKYVNIFENVFLLSSLFMNDKTKSHIQNRTSLKARPKYLLSNGKTVIFKKF